MYLLFVMPSCRGGECASGASPVGCATRPDESIHRICCLVESRGVAVEVGIAFIDLSTAECVIGQFADTPTFTGLCRQIEVLGPDLVGKRAGTVW